MELLLGCCALVQGVMAALFAVAALVLTVIAARIGWEAVAFGLDEKAAPQSIEAIGLPAAAVVALQKEDERLKS